MPRQPYVPFEDSVYRPLEHIWSLRGVAPDKPQAQLGDDYLTSALNFVVRNGVVSKRDGYAVDPVSGGTVAGPSTCSGLFEYFSPSNGATLLMGGESAIRVYIAGIPVIFTGSGSISHDPTIANLSFFTSMRTASSGFRVIHVNGKNPPSWWAGSTAAGFATLTTAVVGACAIAWKNHLLQGDTTDTADGRLECRVRWSALGSPAIWTGTASAGNIDLTDANGSGVQNFMPLGRVLAVYKEQAVHALVYKAAPLYFTQTVLHPRLSTMSRRSVCMIENGDRHFVLSREGAVLYDGQTVRPIGADRVDQTIFRSMSWPNASRTWCCWNAADREILLGIFTNSGVMRVWIYSLQYDAWWETDLPFWIADTAYYLYDRPRLVALNRNDTALYNPFNSATTDTTSNNPISCSIQTGLYDYGAWENKGLLSVCASISPTPNSAVTVTLTKAAQPSPLVTPSFTSSQTVVVSLGQSPVKFDFRRTERFIGYRLAEGPSTDSLKIDRLIPEVTERTARRIKTT